MSGNNVNEVRQGGGRGVGDKGEYQGSAGGGGQQIPSHPFADQTNRPSSFFPPPASLEASWKNSVGLGRPAGTEGNREDRRDITIKAPQHRAPAPPDFPLVEPSSLSRSTSVPSNSTRPGHRHSKSTSSVAAAPSPHARIPDPVYVRSQRISLSPAMSRSTSLRSDLADEERTLSPTISGGVTRCLSVSSFSSGDEDDGANGEETKAVERPLARRSESLPCFPPPEVLALREREDRDKLQEEKKRRDLDSLPPSVKMWLPSHLALYLSHTLSLPPQVSNDITAFIRTSRLSGRTFLRLRDAEFEELGVSVPWRVALGKARDELLEAVRLGGETRIELWGFGGGGEEDDATTQQRPGLGGRRPSQVDVEGSADEDEVGKEEWKRSWRAMGRNTPGRVRGLREAFEPGSGGVERVDEVSEPSGSPVKRDVRTSNMAEGERSKWKEQVKGWRMSWQEGNGHGRSESTDSALSAASVDSIGGRYKAMSASAVSSLRDGERTTEDPFLPDTRPGRALSSSTTASTPLTDAHPRYSSLSNSDRGLPFPFSSPVDTPSSSSFLRQQPPRLELDLASAPPSPTPSSANSSHLRNLDPPKPDEYQSNISAHTLPYAPVRRPSYSGASSAPANALRTLGRLREREGGTLVWRKGCEGVRFQEFGEQAKHETGDEDSEGEGGEPTVRPTRHQGDRSRSGASSGDWGVTSPSTAQGGLAELFGLELPKTRKGGSSEGSEGLATLFVPGAGEETRGGRKGSLVLVKKSQLAALHRRIDEVESLVSSALSLEPSAPSSPAHGERKHDSTYRGLPGEVDLDQVELAEEGERVDGLEHLVRDFVSRPTSSTSPSISPCSSILRSSSASEHTRDTSTSTATSSNPSRRPDRHARRKVVEDSDEMEEEGMQWPLGWRQLSGYVVAASIGIGIVAGEVIISQVFGAGLRRR